jgi:hypothetical protein
MLPESKMVGKYDILNISTIFPCHSEFFRHDAFKKKIEITVASILDSAAILNF